MGKIRNLDVVLCSEGGAYMIARPAWAGWIIVVVTGGCTALVGLDDEFVLRGKESSGGGSGSADSASSTGGAGGAGGTGGTGGTGMGADCAKYCTDIMANCADMNAQYSSSEACMATCKTFPAGTAADTSGNTAGCRTYHAGAAKMDPPLHCPHAGPSGDGACGMDCEGFCSVVVATCPTEYKDAASCATACAGIKNDVDYSAAVTSGDSLSCRLYHATVATTDPATHCPHTVAATQQGDPCFGM
jgi:hypothetical protein